MRSAEQIQLDTIRQIECAGEQVGQLALALASEIRAKLTSEIVAELEGERFNFHPGSWTWDITGRSIAIVKRIGAGE